MATDVKDELVDFVVHQVFYPVLMADRAGPNKAMIEYLQDAARAEIERFRSCKSLKEVIDKFERDRRTQSYKDGYTELRMLNLPVLGDLRQDFERKVFELGFARVDSE